MSDYPEPWNDNVMSPGDLDLSDVPPGELPTFHAAAEPNTNE